MADDLACQALVELVTEYLEGALPPDLRARFDTHLDLCEGCRNHLEQMRRTIELSGGLRDEDVEPEVMDRLMEAFRSWHRRE